MDGEAGQRINRLGDNQRIAAPDNGFFGGEKPLVSSSSLPFAAPFFSFIRCLAQLSVGHILFIILIRGQNTILQNPRTKAAFHLEKCLCA